MIRHLTQVNFRRFGIIASERAQNSPIVQETAAPQILSLSQGETPVYFTKTGCKLRYKSGMTVLSVSENGKEFQHFYLDKSVFIHSNIYFTLSPYQQTASAELCAAEAPEIVGVYHPDGDLAVGNRLKITNIYTFFYHEKEQGFLFPGESHPIFELTYVDQGTLHSVVDGQDLVLGQGDMAIYGPDQWHMQYADIGVAPQFVTIAFQLQGSNISSLLNRKIKMPQRAITLLQQMLREQEHIDAYSDDMLLSLLNQLLLTLLREMDTPVSGTLRAANSVHSENEIIRRAQQYVSTHIREKLTVPLVARMVDVSPSYLTALFHKNLQISPGEYIRRIKLNESKQMIREDNLNFTEIAAALQYSTVHHFSRQFKEKFGITPSEYAKSVK